MTTPLAFDQIWEEANKLTWTEVWAWADEVGYTATARDLADRHLDEVVPEGHGISSSDRNHATVDMIRAEYRHRLATNGTAR